MNVFAKPRVCRCCGVVTLKAMASPTASWNPDDYNFEFRCGRFKGVWLFDNRMVKVDVRLNRWFVVEFRLRLSQSFSKFSTDNPVTFCA
ncbi:hypothetical protein ALC53_13795 [Atta colombica]|uniref:Uncharacterized protein n=1 Tax=Atta colombica TaxID=520822 RepID=A0A195AUJ7_9HYME|nr:hypothetical protein ALC53_13795 [Atta colombica]